MKMKTLSSVFSGGAALMIFSGVKVGSYESQGYDLFIYGTAAVLGVLGLLSGIATKNGFGMLFGGVAIGVSAINLI